MTHQQQVYFEAIRNFRRVTSHAKRRARRAEEAAEESRRQLDDTKLQLGQQQKANDALKAQLAVVRGQIEEQTAVTLAGQLAELRASEHAAAVRTAHAESDVEAAAARSEAAERVTAARAEAAEMVAAARAEAAAEAVAARSEAAQMIAAARAEAAAARDGATGAAAAAAPLALVRHCLEAIRDSK